MNEKKMKSMEFSVLGSSSWDCGFSLTGRSRTLGAEICSKIQQELEGGTLDIAIKGNIIQFMFEGVSISFTENPERLLVVEEMLTSGRHLNREPYADSNYEGFALMVAG